MRNVSGIGQSFLNLGMVAYAQGENQVAQGYMEDALEIFRVVHYPLGLGLCLVCLGKIALNQANFDQAQNYMGESLELGRNFGLQPQLAMSLDLAGLIDLEKDNLSTALAHCEEAIAICRTINDQMILFDTLCHAALICGKLNDLTGAHRHLREGLTFINQDTAVTAKLEVVMIYAQLCLLEGNAQYSAQLVGLISTYSVRNLTQRWLNSLHSQLGQVLSDDIFKAGLMDGRTWLIDSVIEQILAKI
jgi:tetratricopeptide (TPR) repeat protein